MSKKLILGSSLSVFGLLGLVLSYLLLQPAELARNGVDTPGVLHTPKAEPRDRQPVAQQPAGGANAAATNRDNLVPDAPSDEALGASPGEALVESPGESPGESPDEPVVRQPLSSEEKTHIAAQMEQSKGQFDQLIGQLASDLNNTEYREQLQAALQNSHEYRQNILKLAKSQAEESSQDQGQAVNQDRGQGQAANQDQTEQ